MDITLTTPALLFPAVTFLLVAYTNRFLALGSRIRNLHDRYRENPDEILSSQIKSLRRRVVLIRNMQACAVFGLFLCVFCMVVLFAGWVTLGNLIFGASLFLFLASLAISFREILLSVEALNLELKDMEKGQNTEQR
jgi:ABC-type multidrug transport system permease subunit